MQISQNGINGSVTNQASTLDATYASASVKPSTKLADTSLTDTHLSDTAAISATASLLAQGLATVPPETSQVRQISSSVLNGSYKIDPATLASSVMDAMLQPGAE